MQKRMLLRALAGCIVAALMFTVVSGCNRAPSTDAQDAVSKRVRALEDREEIRQLTMDYGRYLDKRDWVAFSALYAEKEGEWVGGMGSAQGPQAIRKLMEDTIGGDTGKPGPPNFHVFTNQIFDLDGDRASGTTKWMFVVPGEGGRPQPVYLGHYEDTFVRENGRWKFLRRVVHADIPPDNVQAPKEAK
ncbi:MAG: hypothetical protein H6Q05_4186 [Acidobacteria bacterium]|nr:hypothetical protein [Acidobacteriota bacterium]